MSTRIRIITTPGGSDIPEEIRKGWVGVELDVLGKKTIPLCSLADKNKYEGTSEVYGVKTKEALEALRSKNSKSYQWFMSKAKLGDVICFLAENCLEIG